VDEKWKESEGKADAQTTRYAELITTERPRERLATKKAKAPNPARLGRGGFGAQRLQLEIVEQGFALNHARNLTHDLEEHGQLVLGDFVAHLQVEVAYGLPGNFLFLQALLSQENAHRAL
jgi:hypothetical protein